MQGKEIFVKDFNVLTLTLWRLTPHGANCNILYSMESRKKLVGTASYLKKEDAEEVQIEMHNNGGPTITLAPEVEKALKERVMQEGRNFIQERGKISS